SRVGLGLAGFEPREVEQLVDEVRQPRRLDRDRRREGATVVVRETLALQRLAGGDDRRQRRTQVVRDGAQQGGLQLVAAAQRLCLYRGPGPRARLLRQGAGDHSDDEEERQRHPVLALGDIQRPFRRDVEEVEGEGAGDRGEEAEPESPVGGDDEDAEHVDDTRRDRRRDRAQRVDEPGRHRHAGDSDEEAGGRRFPPAYAGGGQQPAGCLDHGLERTPAPGLARPRSDDYGHGYGPDL